MERNVKYDCLEFLKNSHEPVIIYALTEESEAIAKACEDNGIKVAVFCDNEIRKTKERLNQIYSKHTGKKIDEIEKIMERDKYFSPDEAIKFGLIDKIVESRKS